MNVPYLAHCVPVLFITVFHSCCVVPDPDRYRPRYFFGPYVSGSVIMCPDTDPDPYTVFFSGFRDFKN
jgi:hypothetical protein